MADPGSDDAAGAPTPVARPTAASVIADLWSEREQSKSAAPSMPPSPNGGDRGHTAPVPDRTAPPSNTGAVVAVVVVALLLGAGAGFFLYSQGFGQTSRAAFVGKADAVCGPANGAVTALAKPSSYPELATAAGTLVTSTDAQLAGLGKLSAPGGADGARVGALLTAMTQTNAAGRSLRDAAGRADDRATAAAVNQMRTSSTDAAAKAGELGLGACATGMQPGVDAVAGGAAGIVKTAFVAKADVICRAAARDLGGIREPRDAREALRAFNQALPIMEKILSDLKALPVPPGDDATMAEIIGGLDKGLANVKQTRAALVAGDRSRLVALDQEATVLTTAVDAKLDAYGLTTCGSNFGGR